MGGRIQGDVKRIFAARVRQVPGKNLRDEFAHIAAAVSMCEADVFFFDHLCLPFLLLLCLGLGHGFNDLPEAQPSVIGRNFLVQTDLDA